MHEFRNRVKRFVWIFFPRLFSERVFPSLDSLPDKLCGKASGSEKDITQSWHK
jgi:hypothetical protein